MNGSLTMHDGRRIPQLGFGVFQVPPEDTAEVVGHALATGYRHIDTAAAYRNEEGVARALARADVPRAEVFVTTKLWNSDQGAARRAFAASRERLGGDPVDLYLIHWPVPAAGRFLDAWRALADLQAAGEIRSIGVSNFRAEDLRRLIEETGVVPAVNQIELHPRLQQRDLRAVHAEHGILTEAWAPLGQGEALRDATIGEIAQAHGRTPAQVVIRWHLQLGTVVIPKSVTPSRIAENFDVFSFELGDDEMAAIAALDAGARIGPDPGEFAVGAPASPR